jgi:hypothetical protein
MRIETGIPVDDWRAVPAAAKAAEAAGFDTLINAEIAHDPFVPCWSSLRGEQERGRQSTGRLVE